MANWVARNSDNRWMVNGYGNPALIHTEPASYTLVDVPGDACPDPRTEMYDVAAPSKKRAATAQEIAAYDAAVLSATSLTTSRQKDILTTLACSVRRSNVAAWNAMTTQQKVTATLAEADIWKTIRDWAETNF